MEPNDQSSVQGWLNRANPLLHPAHLQRLRHNYPLAATVLDCLAEAAEAPSDLDGTSWLTRDNVLLDSSGEPLAQDLPPHAADVLRALRHVSGVLSKPRNVPAKNWRKKCCDEPPVKERSHGNRQKPAPSSADQMVPRDNASRVSAVAAKPAPGGSTPCWLWLPRLVNAALRQCKALYIRGLQAAFACESIPVSLRFRLLQSMLRRAGAIPMAVANRPSRAAQRHRDLLWSQALQDAACPQELAVWLMSSMDDLRPMQRAVLAADIAAQGEANSVMLQSRLRASAAAITFARYSGRDVLANRLTRNGAFRESAALADWAVYLRTLLSSAEDAVVRGQADKRERVKRDLVWFLWSSPAYAMLLDCYANRAIVDLDLGDRNEAIDGLRWIKRQIVTTLEKSEGPSELGGSPLSVDYRARIRPERPAHGDLGGTESAPLRASGA